MDTILIPLANGKGHAIIDEADLPLVDGHGWCLAIRRKNSYAVAAIESRLVYMHYLISGVLGVDHKNGNGLDNRRCNLREATTSQNEANSGPRGGSSSFKGVYWNRNAKKWHAQVKLNYHRRHLGYFDDEAEAAQAYDVAAREAWGEFAHLNFP